ncbi:hypothetical protein ACFX15_002523 [Malus domestica]
MAAFSAFMSGGACKFQSLTDLRAVQGSQQVLAKSQENLNRNISNLKLWTDAYVHTPEDVKLAIELRDDNQWTASFTTAKSNPNAGMMKVISDKARPPLRLQFKRITEIVEVKKKPTAIGQHQEEGEQGGYDKAEALNDAPKGKKGKKGKGQRGKGSKVKGK